MGVMKNLDLWFSEKYDEYDDDIGEWKGKYCLYFMDAPPEKGNGIRIVIIRKDEEDGNMSYSQDFFEGTDYEKNLESEDMFHKVIGFIEDMMENMPKY